MSAVTLTLRYASASQLAREADRQTLSLVSSSDRDPSEHRHFLKAQARHPHVTARGLRAVSDIVGSRFYVPPAMLARILREADPVATVSPGAVRFEGFSACCSAYIRLDMDEAALESAQKRSGTTNVDFGPEVRAALAQVPRDGTLGLTIGPESVTITRGDTAVVEKKVPLPLRWIKGFAEVQGNMAGMQPALDLSPFATKRLLRQLSRGSSDHLQWISCQRGIPQLSQRKTEGAVPLRGAQRLRVLEPLVSLAEGLHVHVNTTTGASAWVLELPGQRLCLVLNKDPWQGFSGDGGLLTQLATSDGSAVTALKAQLNWQDHIDETTLREATGLPQHTVSEGLAALAASGLLGFDLHRGGYFHRVLPFDLDRIEARNPRLAAARRLVAAGAVLRTDGGADVTSGDTTHRVLQQPDGWRCTCPWYARNGPTRGPCKHILAAKIDRENGT